MATRVWIVRRRRWSTSGEGDLGWICSFIRFRELGICVANGAGLGGTRKGGGWGRLMGNWILGASVSIRNIYFGPIGIAMSTP